MIMMLLQYSSAFWEAWWFWECVEHFSLGGIGWAVADLVAVGNCDWHGFFFLCSPGYILLFFIRCSIYLGKNVFNFFNSRFCLENPSISFKNQIENQGMSQMSLFKINFFKRSVWLS